MDPLLINNSFGPGILAAGTVGRERKEKANITRKQAIIVLPPEKEE